MAVCKKNNCASAQSSSAKGRWQSVLASVPDRSHRLTFSALLFLTLFDVLCGGTPKSPESAKLSTPLNVTSSVHPHYHSYLHSIFSKYGVDGLMTFEGFEHLLENLGIGNVRIPDHDIHAHHHQDGFRELHEDHNHTSVLPATPPHDSVNGTEEGDAHDRDHSHDEGYEHSPDHNTDRDIHNHHHDNDEHEHRGHAHEDDHDDQRELDDVNGGVDAGSVVHGAVGTDRESGTTTTTAAARSRESDVSDHGDQRRRRKRFVDVEREEEVQSDEEEGVRKVSCFDLVSFDEWVCARNSDASPRAEGVLPPGLLPIVGFSV